jgi:CRP-like cAMP-binding protein
VPGAVIASNEGVISVSAEGVAIVETIETPQLPADLPPDEVVADDSGLFMDDGASGDIVELTEPAQVDVDKIPPIPLFSDLPKEAFIALTERMDLRIATNGDVLVQEGERGSSMFVIIQGKVVVKRQDSESGQDIVLAELDDGTFFGEMALLSDAPRVASVVCADDTMLFEISRELLADITNQYPSVGEVMKRFHKNRLLTNLLKTSPIFQPFSATDKKGLIEKFKSRSVDEGTYLITRERPGEGLYVLLSGRCEVLDTGADGKEVLLAELKEGDVFGEMSMLWHKKTCASVKAITPCVVLRLPRDQFNEVIMTHPQILETLTALSERRAKQNEELRTPAGNDMLL